MAIDTYTLSFAEIFDKVSKLKSKKDKVAFLRLQKVQSIAFFHMKLVSYTIILRAVILH